MGGVGWCVLVLGVGLGGVDGEWVGGWWVVLGGGWCWVVGGVGWWVVLGGVSGE